MKVRSLSVCLLTLALFFPLTTNAEYYVVYDRGACKGSRHHVRHYKKVVHYRRHSACGCMRHRIRANAVVQYVRPAIPCNGCAVSRAASCGGNCEGWFPSAWEASNYEILATKPVFFENDYDPDLATADDNQFYYPDLNIDR